MTDHPEVRSLRQEILRARERVYRFGKSSPLEAFPNGGSEIWVKREDLCPVKSYKWRGACNRMALLSPEEAQRGVVAASAGNHAQGVALAAAALGIRARIFMPRTTPAVKQEAVLRHGAGRVETVIGGDSYDDALQAALAESRQEHTPYIHAYDDPLVMAGQGTLADEIVLSGRGPFDIAYLQIGGGGMAAGVSTWLRSYWPAIRLIGVEGEGQACTKEAFAAGQPVPLEEVDLFCDGTAVRQVGTHTFPILRETLDEIVTVSNEEVAGAIRSMWDGLRAIPEPAGAMGLAAALRDRSAHKGKRVLVILCGANLDFQQLGDLSYRTSEKGRPLRHLRIQIPERAGSMLALLDECFAGVSIRQFLYAKDDSQKAWPIFGLVAQTAAMTEMTRQLDAANYCWEDITGAEDIAFRAISLQPDQLSYPTLLRLDFYERPGALHDFLSATVRGKANIAYFNYRYTGERVGRALLGLDFDSAAHRREFLEALPESGPGVRSCRPLDPATAQRILSTANVC
ncbi:MAG: pyridoxal-phosphate dependent enzyme [Verrucomicrobiota bacterium]